MPKAMLEELRATLHTGDEREARETETNGDQRDGDEELSSEKLKEPGGGRFKERDANRAGQSASLPSVRKTLVDNWLPR